MRLQDLLTTYWSQVLLVLLTISYFIKRIFDARAKKIEISYSLFQQSKIKAITNFFANYSKVEFMWHKIPYWEIIEHRISTKEIDEIVWPPLDDLKQATLELKIYFLSDEHSEFQKILENALSINTKLKEQYSSYTKEKDIIELTNRFLFHKEAKLQDNSKIIEKITGVIRTAFEHK